MCMSVTQACLLRSKTDVPFSGVILVTDPKRDWRLIPDGRCEGGFEPDPNDPTLFTKTGQK